MPKFALADHLPSLFSFFFLVSPPFRLSTRLPKSNGHRCFAISLSGPNLIQALGVRQAPSSYLLSQAWGIGSLVAAYSGPKVTVQLRSPGFLDILTGGFWLII